MSFNSKHLIIEIRNRYFLENLPFHCDIDVFCFKLLKNKLTSNNDLVFYNNYCDDSESLIFLPVGDFIYDCDSRIKLNYIKLFQEKKSIKIICCPNLFNTDNTQNTKGFFEIKIKFKKSNFFSFKNFKTWKSNFEIENYPMLVFEIDYSKDKKIKVNFPNKEIRKNIDEIINQFS